MSRTRRYAARMTAHLGTTTNGERDWRSAGLRHGSPASGSCKGAVPEAGAPVVVSCAPRTTAIVHGARSYRLGNAPGRSPGC